MLSCSVFHADSEAKKMPQLQQQLSFMLFLLKDFTWIIQSMQHILNFVKTAALQRAVKLEVKYYKFIFSFGSRTQIKHS